MSLTEIVNFVKGKGFKVGETSLLLMNIKGKFITASDERGGLSFDFEKFKSYFEKEIPEGYILLGDACKKYGFSLQYLCYRRRKGDVDFKRCGIRKKWFAKESDVKKLGKRVYVPRSRKGGASGRKK